MNYYEAIDHMREVLEALKSGKKIEFCDSSGDWIDLPEDVIPNFSKIVYRIKPELPKYRVGLFNNHGDYYPMLVVNEEVANNTENDDSEFVRWLTDWTEYKV